MYTLARLSFNQLTLFNTFFRKPKSRVSTHIESVLDASRAEIGSHPCFNSKRDIVLPGWKHEPMIIPTKKCGLDRQIQVLFLGMSEKSSVIIVAIVVML